MVVTVQRNPGDRRGATDDDRVEACLVANVIDGSEDAFASIIERHEAAVFAEATRTSRDHTVGSEVVQDTFLTLWNRAELFDPNRGRLRAWLVSIAHNRALDHLRRARRRDRATPFSSFNPDPEQEASTVDWLTSAGQPIGAGVREPGPEASVVRKETREAISAAVASLSSLERSVIALAYDGGLSQSEIAVRLGWPIGTVKTRTRSALRHLRDRLQRSDDVLPAGRNGGGVSWQARSRVTSPRATAACSAPCP